MAEKDVTPWGTTLPSRQNFAMEGAKNYLIKRGFTGEDLEKLGVEIVPIDEVTKFVPRVSIRPYHADSAAIILPHYNPIGESYGYATARIVQPDIKIASFASQIDPPKLLAPGGLIPKPHFSRFNPSEYDSVYVTESRLKADIIAKCGFFAIGLNGVWGWSHKNSNSKILPEIWEFPWNHVKRVVFVPDSNTHKPEVMAAVVQFAANMRMRNVEVKLAKVPRTDNGDQGIDDFYAANGRTATTTLLLTTIEEIEKDEITAKKWALNEEVVFVRQLSRYAEIESGHLMSYSEFTKGNYGNWISYTEEGKPLSIAQAWNAWDKRREVEEMAYRPGLSPLVDGDFLNLWKGMGCVPVKGDASPFLEFMENNFPNPVERNWILQWFAYPLQNLGAKMATSLVLIGQQGTGKSLLGNIISSIYGRSNAVMITREQLDSSFNSIYSAKQFVVVDEMSKNSRRDIAQASSNKLKNLITEPCLLVNRKGQPEYEIENRMNIMMTSNHMDALLLEEGDRRFYIAEISAVKDRRHDPAYWNDFASWCFGNIGQIYDFLLSYSLDGFEAFGRAPETEAKKQMIEASYTDEQQLATSLMEDATGIMKALGLKEDTKYIIASKMLEAWWALNGRPNKPQHSNLVKFANCLKDLGAKKIEFKMSGEKIRALMIGSGDIDMDKARLDAAQFVKKR